MLCARHWESKELGCGIQHTIQRTYTRAGEDAEKLGFSLFLGAGGYKIRGMSIKEKNLAVSYKTKHEITI